MAQAGEGVGIARHALNIDGHEVAIAIHRAARAAHLAYTPYTPMIKSSDGTLGAREHEVACPEASRAPVSIDTVLVETPLHVAVHATEEADLAAAAATEGYERCPNSPAGSRNGHVLAGR